MMSNACYPLFDRGDLRGRDIPPPPRSGSERELRDWVQRAASRLDHPALRERLVGMTAHMARWHAWCEEPDEAGHCLAISLRLRDPQRPLGDEPLVRAMLERSVPAAGEGVDERQSAIDRVGDPALRGRIRRGPLRVKGVPRGRHLAQLDLTEAAFLALEVIFEGLPSERLPREDQRMNASYQAALVFVEAMIRSVAGGERGTPAELGREIAHAIGSVSGLNEDESARCAAELLPALGLFVRETCGACPVRCFAKPNARIRHLFDGAGHPAHQVGGRDPS